VDLPQAKTKSRPRHRPAVGFAGGSAGMAVSRYSPVALCHRLSTALLWAASCSWITSRSVPQRSWRHA